MRNTFNSDLLLIALGCVQPASQQEVIGFLRITFPDVKHWPSEAAIQSRFLELQELNYVIEVRKKYYSLTLLANERMDVKHKRLRDKTRLSLLRAAYDASLKQSEAEERDLVGVSPTVNSSSSIQDGSRPITSGPESSPPEGTRLRARRYWPRVTEQLSQVGLVSSASDTSNYRYCSFPTLKLLHRASGSDGPERDMTLSQLALAIGVTPRLLSSFIHKKENHYRTFSIPKKGGGERSISSPRFFLKTVQYWIKSYFLKDLRVHSSAHAYREGFSIQTNAASHVGRKFVANVDIVDFFGSVRASQIKRILVSHDIGNQLASAISKLVTLDGGLPQGAPTSPVLSNAFLFRFDCVIENECSALGLFYSRYADDITISGDDRDSVLVILKILEKELLSLGLRLNDAKTRIASSNSSQRVTGLVVNEGIRPPREYLRKVRSMFHNASKEPDAYVSRFEEMKGHYSYLSSFDSLQGSRHLRRYKMVLRKLGASLRNSEGDAK